MTDESTREQDVVWSDEVDHLAAAALVEAPLDAQMAAWLAAAPASRVADVGCGAGGMTVALAARLPGARIDAFDAEPAILEAARRRVAAAAPDARIEFHRAELDSLAAAAGSYDLVWAGAVVHHLPDQQAGVDRLARLLRPGGRLVLGEGGLPLRCLPYDVGLGRPGLEARLSAAQGAWFDAMRAAMPGGVRTPGGWSQLLTRAGLVEATTRSFLFEAPPPLSDAQRTYLLAHLRSLHERPGVAARLDADDLETLRRLLDPGDPAYVGRRHDTFLLTARSVHLAWRPAGWR